MPIEPPLPSDTRSWLADWLEVASLIHARGAGSADLAGLFALLQDSGHDLQLDEVTGEQLESEILEEERALFAEQVLAEIEYRAAVLGGDYPFVLESIGSQWRIVRLAGAVAAQLGAARCCYVFCLLASALRDDCLHGARGAELKRLMERLFQAVAVDAAAAIMHGEVISFGWPRPAGDGFRAALAALCGRLRLGVPVQDQPVWSKGQEKDAGIDVIAWREFRDRRAGKLVMLGQVASGRDWMRKSVINDTPRFFAWFSQLPMEHFIPSIFIPFPQHHECSPRTSVPFDEAAEGEAWLLERQLGLVVDRLRVVEVAASRLARGHKPDGRIDLGEAEPVGGRGASPGTVGGMSRRHPFHSICPYFAMFPEQFVEQQLLSYTVPGDVVFDPVLRARHYRARRVVTRSRSCRVGRQPGRGVPELG